MNIGHTVLLVFYNEPNRLDYTHFFAEYISGEILYHRLRWYIGATVFYKVFVYGPCFCEKEISELTSDDTTLV